MPRKFWYTIIKSTNKDKVQEKWSKIVKKSIKEAILKHITKLLKTQEKINERGFEEISSKKYDGKGPREKPIQYPMFYVKKGRDKKYYIRSKDGYWDKITQENLDNYLLTAGIPYSLGYMNKQKYGNYNYADLPKKVKHFDDIIKYMKKEQKYWLLGMAVEFKDSTIIGGYVAN